MPQAKSLPARPNLAYLRKLAKDRLADLRALDGQAKLYAAQLAVAREHGFASWRRLKTHVDHVAAASPEFVGQLMQAINQGKAPVVRRMIRAHKSLIRSADSDGMTPLHAAAGANQPRIMEMLIEAGADANALLGRSAHTALSWAVTTAGFDAAKVLRKYGVKPDLYCAAGLGDVDAVRSWFDKTGRLIASACKTGSSRYGADGSLLPCPPTTEPERISDALYIACRQGRTAVVEL